MKRIDTGVRQYRRGNGIGRDLALVLVPLATVVAFLWWLGSLQFWR